MRCSRFTAKEAKSISISLVHAALKKYPLDETASDEFPHRVLMLCKLLHYIQYFMYHRVLILLYSDNKAIQFPPHCFSIDFHIILKPLLYSMLFLPFLNYSLFCFILFYSILTVTSTLFVPFRFCSTLFSSRSSFR